MAAIILSKIRWSKSWNLILLAVGWAMVILIFVFKSFVYKSGLVNLGLNITILSLGIALILFWMHENHRLGNEKNRIGLQWLRKMGVYSYEIYLTHMFVILFGVKVFKRLELKESWLIPCIIILVMLSYYLGKLVFHYFSEPLNIWLRKKNRSPTQ